MTDAALDEPVLVFAREFFGIGTSVRVWRTIGITFKRNGGHADDRPLSKSPFQIAWLHSSRPFAAFFGPFRAPERWLSG